MFANGKLIINFLFYRIYLIPKLILSISPKTGRWWIIGKTTYAHTNEDTGREMKDKRSGAHIYFDLKCRSILCKILSLFSNGYASLALSLPWRTKCIDFDGSHLLYKWLPISFLSGQHKIHLSLFAHPSIIRTFQFARNDNRNPVLLKYMFDSILYSEVQIWK